MKHQLYTTVNLRLFDGEGAGASAGAGEGAATGTASEQAQPSSKADLKNVVYGKQRSTEEPQTSMGKAPEIESNTTVAQDDAFEQLIKGEHKDAFNRRVQKIIDARFKETKQLEAQAKKATALDPVLEMLSSKYGTAKGDTDALLKAIQDDDSYYEEEAIDRGLTVEQLKNIKKLERENAEFKAAREAQERQQQTNQVLARWEEQSQQLRQIYPGFDLNAETSHPETGKRFSDLLRNGVDIRTAYEVVHKDDILSGAMSYTAQQVQRKTINDIRARGMRPQENGGSGRGAATIVKSDPRSFTKADREEIARRVMRGERIEL